MRRAITAFAGVLLVGALALQAQEFRASITGTVTDGTGSAVPNVKVTATNAKTNVATSTVTNDSGNYTIPFLMPGEYDIATSVAWFKDAVRKAVELRVSDRLGLNFRVELADVQTSVEVTTAAPLLQTATASIGSVVDRRRVSELPLLEGNPLVLAQLGAGVAFINRNSTSLRPFDAGSPAALQVGGAPGGMEFTLDGAPNTAVRRTTSSALGGPGISFTPPTEAIQEFKVTIASFDAQQGHTGGGTVSISMRSGTNEYHGSGYEFFRPTGAVANDFFLKRAGEQPDTFTYHRFGGTTGGPVRIPKLYDGRNKTFYFFALEGIIWDRPATSLRTVPTLAQRQGDFSALLAQNMIMYDPLTAVSAPGGRIQRSPFGGNVIPSTRLSPIGKNVIGYYPEPTLPGTAQGQNNFLSKDISSNRYNTVSFRIDHVLNEKNRAFFRAYRNLNSTGSGLGWAGVVNGIKPTLSAFSRGNQGFSYDHVYLLGPTKVLNVRGGVTRYFHTNGLDGAGFDLTNLGFPASTLVYLTAEKYFPVFQPSAYDQLGGTNGNYIALNTFSFQPTLTWMRGRHSFRFGWDARAYRENELPKHDSAGVYSFDGTYTRGPLDNSPSAPMGQGMAALLLGLPTGGYIDRIGTRASQSLYHGLFFQDDFKVNSRLTLNLGLRYDYEGASTERYNRNARGFDLSSPNPIEAAARAAYAAKPDASGIGVNDFKVRGGMLFADSKNRGIWISDKNNLEPRAGFAFQAASRVVLRGGWGMYMSPYNIDGTQQAGFSQSTQIVTSMDGGLSFVGSLANPFPSGVLTPPGASGGLTTFIGQSLSFVPLDKINPQSHRFTMGLQVQLPGQWLFEGTYIGNRSFDIPISTQLDPIPAKYLSTSKVRDDDAINFLTAKVTNPLRGLAPGTGLDASTIARSQLLRPYPQFTGLTTEAYNGSSRSDSALFRMERRFRQGFTLEANYTISRLRERVSFLNETDIVPEDRVSVDDRPTRLALSGIWEFPFGKGRHWGRQWGAWTDRLLGGWQVGGIYMWQSGRPLSIGNRYFAGYPGALSAKFDTRTVDLPVFDASGFYFHDAAVQTKGVDDPAKQRNDKRISLANNIRTLPTFLGGFRGSPITGLDLSAVKTVSLGERFKVQFRGEVVNAVNTVQFGDPSLDPTKATFGIVSSQDNYPRQMQFSFKVLF